MIDPIETIRTILLSDTAIANLVGDDIWDGYVPPSLTPYMPKKSILILCDSAPMSPLIPVIFIRAIFWCFGEEPGFSAAWQVARAIYDCLIRGGNRIVHTTDGDVYYYTSDCITVGREVTEPTTGWPRVVCEYLFQFYEEAQ